MHWDSKAIAKIFNSSTLNEIANGDFSYIEHIASQYFLNNSTMTIRNLYDEAYAYLSRNYRNEYFYKNLIIKKILTGRHSLHTATMLPEFRVGLNKADCVILNGKSTCYEIKTDYDSLARLKDQLSSYLQLFDEVYVVCSEKYLQSILELAPIEVGVLNLTQKQSLRKIRKASPRAAPINRIWMMQSLRQHEYRELAEKLSGQKIISPNGLIYNKCFSIIEKFEDETLLNQHFIQILKNSRKNNVKMICNLPESLANAAISYRFKKREKDTLIRYFSEEEGAHVLSNITGQTKRIPSS